MARPTKYDADSAPVIARALLRNGFSFPDLSETFGVSRQTLFQWRRKHPEFAEAVKLGRDESDYIVEDALYRRAIGACEVKETRRKTVRGPDGELLQSSVETTTKTLPPDVKAQLVWLRLRRPDKWDAVVHDIHDMRPPVMIELGVVERRVEDDPGKPRLV